MHGPHLGGTENLTVNTHELLADAAAKNNRQNTHTAASLQVQCGIMSDFALEMGNMQLDMQHRQ